jgi:hypothetical protein
MILFRRVPRSDRLRAILNHSHSTQRDSITNKSSKKAKSQSSREQALLNKVHLDAAAIDVGAYTHWVAVPEDRGDHVIAQAQGALSRRTSIMGTSIPTRVQRVVFMQRTPKAVSIMNNRMPPFNHCRVGESERVRPSEQYLRSSPSASFRCVTAIRSVNPG